MAAEMATVDELFDAFRTAYTAGERADPTAYLRRLDGADRSELAVLIDGFLAAAPPRNPAPQAFESFLAASLTRSIQNEIGARMTETWASLLPAERERAEIPRETLVERLARALGVSDREAKVASYYRLMEAGTLPGRGVSDRVLEALSQIIDVPVARLRAAGERMIPPPAAAGGMAAAAPAQPAMDRAAAPPPMARSARARRPERDEVDELFTGGF
jgi:hypothetical protein